MPAPRAPCLRTLRGHGRGMHSAHDVPVAAIRATPAPRARTGMLQGSWKECLGPALLLFSAFAYFQRWPRPYCEMPMPTNQFFQRLLFPTQCLAVRPTWLHVIAQSTRAVFPTMAFGHRRNQRCALFVFPAGASICFSCVGPPWDLAGFAGKSAKALAGKTSRGEALERPP